MASHGAAAPALAPERFLQALRARGFDLFTGVPCSLVKELLRLLAEQNSFLPANREDVALGIAAGAVMGGKRPVVIMQNSGFGLSLNALMSLHMIYKLPVQLLVTWRGYQGKDAPEHVLMGPAMTGIMDAIKLPWRALEPTHSPEQLLATLEWADVTLRESQSPCALVVREGALA